jgi:S1-C subfamily serine protease
MGMPVRCPGCGFGLSVTEEAVGKRIRCRKCGEIFLVDPPDDHDADEVARPQPVTSRDEDAPPKSSSSALWVVGIVLVILLLIGGGVGGTIAFWLTRKPAGPIPQAVAQQDTINVNAAAEIVQHGDEAQAPQKANEPAEDAAKPARPLKPNAPGKDGQLAKEMLEYLKDLTVYIKIEAGHEHGSASGFLIKVDGDTGYIVTNEHVVNHQVNEPERPPSPFGPRFGPRNMPRPGGPPRMPELPGMPNFPDLPNMPLPPIFEQPESSRKVRAKLTVIFGSGTPKERALPAEVLDANAQLDLAIIRVKGPNLPKPMDLSDRAELTETMTAYVLGFPLGEALAVEGNPAITVNKTTIGSVRKNKNGMPVLVQLQAGRNPGNSGGPVVDADGRLVGIWVGSFEGTQIGLALAPPLLDTLLKRTKANIDCTTIKNNGEEMEIEFKVELFDMLNEVNEVRLLHAPGADLPKNPLVLNTGEYAAMPNAKSLNLKKTGKQFTGRLTLAVRDLKAGQLPVQVGYVHRDGTIHYGKPWDQRIGANAGVAAANVPAKGPIVAAAASTQPNATINIPGKVGDVAIGGAGRFLIIGTQGDKQLLVFDLSEAKIAATLSLPEENCLFAANRDHLIVYLPAANKFQRWSLTTFERETEAPSPLGTQVKALALGSASAGPLVAYAPRSANSLALLDPITLQPGDWKFDAAAMHGGVVIDPVKTSLACSADGRTILARGSPDFFVLRWTGAGYHSNRLAGVNTPLPDADGDVVIDHGQAFSADGNALAQNRSRKGAGVWCVPTLQGALCLSLNETHDENNQVFLKPMLHIGGESEPLAVLPQRIDSLSGLVNWFTGQTDPFERHVFLAPEFGTLAVIPWENNRIEIYRFDLDAVLKESKRDFLFVLSQPPAEAKKGSVFRYGVNVKSKKGDVKLQLKAMPAGMKLEGDNTLIWNVPDDFGEKEANVVISIRDASGQTVRHSFRIRVGEK